MPQTPLSAPRSSEPASGSSPALDGTSAELRHGAPRVREGFKARAEAGFPSDPHTGKPEAKYFQRGNDRWVRTPREQASDYVARPLDDISRVSARRAVGVLAQRS